MSSVHQSKKRRIYLNSSALPITPLGKHLHMRCFKEISKYTLTETPSIPGFPIGPQSPADPYNDKIIFDHLLQSANQAIHFIY